MVTVSAATLIVAALVGCGPKPARVVPKYAPPQTIIVQSLPDYDPYRLRELAEKIVRLEPPPIDPNPYRFIGGQRYGEGWGKRRQSSSWLVCDKTKTGVVE